MPLTKEKTMKVRDLFWIWGQNPGAHHCDNKNTYKLPGVNRMGPVEGARYLGVNNCCRVAMGDGPVPPFDRESAELAGMDQVVWSIVGAGGFTINDDGWGDMNEVIRQARMFPNITGAILDDFCTEKRLGIFSPERLGEIRAKMRAGVGRPMDLWVVLYEHQLDGPVKAHLNACDVITFWTWNGANLKNLDANMAKVIAMTPGKRHVAGCYMWDYGGRQPLPLDQMKYQCEKYYQWIKEGKIDGVIFCSNCIADLGLETVAWTRQWIAQIGDEELVLKA